MSDAMIRHDQLIEESIGKNSGRVFKTVGDAFCSAFARASDALRCALDIQRQLADQDFSAVEGLRVRVALHTGEAVERGADYFGPTVNRVARLLALGHGGQILVSAATAEVLGGALDEMDIRDLGYHHLKDLSVPEHVFQVSAERAEADFPPLNSVDGSRHNIPPQTTALVGRAQVVADVDRLLHANRLVTLTGAGGVGKTRTALQVALENVAAFRDGAWLTELASISEAALVPAAVATALHVRESPDEPLVSSLARTLAPRETLLVLDNCEHLVADVAVLVERLLTECPELRILATSREPLDVSGERVYRIPVLAIPPDNTALSADELLSFGAVALFVERGLATGSDFVFDDRVAGIVASICRRLDGIPFAIELAAARLRSLGVRDLEKRLDERFRLLTKGSRTALPRQQTMRALIDWSYNALASPDRELLDRSAVFAGGWTLSAVEKIYSAAMLDKSTVADELSSLVDKSLVSVETVDGNSRYRLLESMRDYALEKLGESGELPLIARLHANWVRDVVEAAQADRAQMRLAPWLERLAPEIENIRAALKWALAAQGNLDVAGRIAGSMRTFWFATGRLNEGLGWTEAILERLDETEYPDTAGRCLLIVATFRSGRQAHEAAERAIRLFERLDERDWLARAYGVLGWVLQQLGRFTEADVATERALVLWRDLSLQHTYDYASDLDSHATILVALRQFDKARAAWAEVQSILERIDEDEGLALAQLNQAEMEFADGHPERARDLARASADTLNRLRSEVRAAFATANLAAYYIALGQIDEARNAAREVLHRSPSSGSEATSLALQHLAAVLALGGMPERAARLGAYVDSWCRNTGYELSVTETSSRDIAMASVRKQLTQEAVQREQTAGAGLSEEQAIREGLADPSP